MLKLDRTELVRLLDKATCACTLAGVAFPWTEVGAIATAAGALAAWRAAGASREAVARANRPFVWPQFAVDEAASAEPGAEDRTVWLVQLHDDGPGVALDVRWSIAFLRERRSVEDKRERHRIRERASEPIRAIQPEEMVSTDRHGERLREAVTHGEQETPWWIVVRFTDSAGNRWRYLEPNEMGELAIPPRKLYRGTPYPLRRLLRVWRARDW